MFDCAWNGNEVVKGYPFAYPAMVHDKRGPWGARARVKVSSSGNFERIVSSRMCCSTADKSVDSTNSVENVANVAAQNALPQPSAVILKTVQLEYGCSSRNGGITEYRGLLVSKDAHECRAR